MSNFDDILFELTPPELSIIAQNASENILPEKSKSRYISTYDEFIAWREEKKANSFSENVMLAYFSELSAKLKPSTLWSRFSIIKSMLKIRNNVDISQYPKLNAFLKRLSDGFTTKKSKILTSNEVERFLNEAPDVRYLTTKVALIFGVVGVCPREELANITLKDIEAHGKMLLIKFRIQKISYREALLLKEIFLE
ncbi:unnamed protein product [Parnassius mnemosyne]|uniref:Uncharacterized protein n=1 Tax=Parnassius mnemosyne TaxID=213953 RepID=A0AAV1MBT3_9NEOP